jgi:cytochrome c-type biogenesis protein CcmH
VRRAAALLIAAVLVVAGAAALVTRADPSTATVSERATALASGLRCPVCQNLSVADSPSALAGEMRREIERRLRAGQGEDEVRDYFVDRYGQWVLLEPPRSGLNVIPWAFPIAALLGGAGVWWVLVRRRVRSGHAPELAEADRRRIERELEGLGEGS